MRTALRSGDVEVQTIQTRHRNPSQSWNPITIPCLRRFQSRWARIISGADEGVYGWIALNYATGHLASAPVTPRSAAPGAPASQPIRLTGAWRVLCKCLPPRAYGWT